MYPLQNKSPLRRNIISSFLILAFLALQSNALLAQDRQEVNKGELPQQVVESIESNYLPCKEKFKWYVTDRGAEIDHYVAKASGDGISCESVYDRDGRLLQAETVLTNVKLPSYITQSVHRDYPGWKISEERMVYRDFNMAKKHFEVVIANDGNKQTLYFDSMGQRMNAAQIENLQFFAVNKNVVPKSVVKAIEDNSLPCKQEPAWYATDKRAQADRYVARTTGKNINCEATYDRRGKLISAYTVMTDIKLPRTVIDKISSNFPGWSLMHDKMIMRDFDEQQKIYEVLITRARDGKTRLLHYDTNGKLIIPKPGEV